MALPRGGWKRPNSTSSYPVCTTPRPLTRLLSGPRRQPTLCSSIHAAQLPTPDSEDGRSWLSDRTGRASASPASAQPEWLERSARPCHGHWGFARGRLGEALGPHPEQLFEVSLDESVRRRLPSPPRSIDRAGDLHSGYQPGGRGTGQGKGGSPAYPSRVSTRTWPGEVLLRHWPSWPRWAGRTCALAAAAA